MMGVAPSVGGVMGLKYTEKKRAAKKEMVLSRSAAEPLLIAELTVSDINSEPSVSVRITLFAVGKNFFLKEVEP